tara:strand:- start:2804 stop:3274 length:471 start_codon:yes stop_codon:yes gene_type:complete
MGRYIARIGKFYAEYGDYQWDYIKQRRKKEYYNDKFIEVSIQDDDKKYDLEERIPILDIVDLNPIKTNYEFGIRDDWNLNKWLLEYIISNIPDYTPKAKLFIENYHAENSREYFLVSGIGKSPIHLSDDGANVFDITEWSQIKWISENGITVKWVD